MRGCDRGDVVRRLHGVAADFASCGGPGAERGGACLAPRRTFCRARSRPIKALPQRAPSRFRRPSAGAGDERRGAEPAGGRSKAPSIETRSLQAPGFKADKSQDPGSRGPHVRRPDFGRPLVRRPGFQRPASRRCRLSHGVAARFASFAFPGAGRGGTGRTLRRARERDCRLPWCERGRLEACRQSLRLAPGQRERLGHAVPPTVVSPSVVSPSVVSPSVVPPSTGFACGRAGATAYPLPAARHAARRQAIAWHRGLLRERQLRGMYRRGQLRRMLPQPHRHLGRQIRPQQNRGAQQPQPPGHRSDIPLPRPLRRAGHPAPPMHGVRRDHPRLAFGRPRPGAAPAMHPTAPVRHRRPAAWRARARLRPAARRRRRNHPRIAMASRLAMLRGTWRTGTWRGGTGRRGTWRGGTGRGGTGRGGTGRSGTWRGGTGRSGIWRRRVWRRRVSAKACLAAGSARRPQRWRQRRLPGSRPGNPPR